MLPTSVIILMVVCIASMVAFVVAMVIKEDHLEALWKCDGKDSESYSRRCANSRKLKLLEGLELFSGIVFIGTALLVIISLFRLCGLFGV